MRRILSLVLTLILLFALPASGNSQGEERIVLTIGDTTDRSDSRVSGADQLGIWKYLEDRLNIEIRYVYLPPDK